MRLFIAVVLCLASAAPAGAATVDFREEGECHKYGCEPDLLYVNAAPGETNGVRVTFEAGTVLIEDTGADLGGACEALGPRVRRCPRDASTGVQVRVELGDGDDRASVVAGNASVAGGDGNDDIHASYAQGDAGDDRLALPEGLYGRAAGGPGDDELIGTRQGEVLDPGPGRDMVVAGAGADTVLDDDPAPSSDALDGGDGRDTLVLGDRTDGVRLDLGAQTTSDGDALSGFENAEGGRGDDVLVGDAGANHFDGGSGDDRLAGGDGDDRLIGGADFDRFDAGAGDDEVDARLVASRRVGEVLLDAEPEPIHCGGGDDQVSPAGDLVHADCERLPFGVPRLPVRVARSGYWAEFAVRCPREFTRRKRCRVEVGVGEAEWMNERFTRRATIPAGRTVRVRVKTNLVGQTSPHLLSVTFGLRPGWSRGVRWIVSRLRRPTTA